jgi:DNA-binding NarL/FixJ family response regulator
MKRNNKMPTKILLADDHAIVRHGLSQSIQKEKDMQVIGQAEDGISTVEMVRELLPDVVIMDISMPDLNGIEATRQIVRDFSGVKVIALSMHSAKKFITEMFKAGASAYLLKDCKFEELAEAIRTVMSGKSYISPEISTGVIENYIKTADQKQSSVYSTLSKREREVLQLLAEGQTTKQIGLKLHISPKTVEAHRLRIMDKLDIDNVAQLTKYAIQEGLTSAEP